jgi:hypothetical protein
MQFQNNFVVSKAKQESLPEHLTVAKDLLV